MVKCPYCNILIDQPLEEEVERRISNQKYCMLSCPECKKILGFLDYY